MISCIIKKLNWFSKINCNTIIVINNKNKIKTTKNKFDKYNPITRWHLPL